MTKNIFGLQAQQLIKNGAIVIDIRDAKDFGISHIPGAINISINDLTNLSLNKNINIIVVCSHGLRSIAAAEKLFELGYTNVYNLKNGYDEYRMFFN